MNEIIRYLIRFILGDHIPKERGDIIGYTSDASAFNKYRVVIIPCGFFDKTIYGTPESLPALPLLEINGVPLLFGEPRVERRGRTLVVYADIIASSYFLLSRYEEIVRRDVRDEHGRFPGRESLPFRAGFIQRPIVDEYGRLLRNWLVEAGEAVESLSEPPHTIRRLYLTHDVDAPFAFRTWRSVIGGIIRGGNIFKILRSRLGSLEGDPYYTFPALLEADRRTAQIFGENDCLIYLFYKAGGSDAADRPRYNLRGRDMQKLYNLALSYHAGTGLHASYRAGKKPARIKAEKRRLQRSLSPEVYANRHHFLASREPEDMGILEKLGFEDDFTMGYADVAGFRLGTARPVYWIHAAKRRLSSKLRLHPLTVMDCTLSESKYMGLTESEALDYCAGLINESRRMNGEVTLLWHNTSVADGAGYHKSLYAELLRLCERGEPHSCRPTTQ